MMVIIVSLCAACCFGCSDFFTMVGLRYSNSRSAILFTTISGLLVAFAWSAYSHAWKFLNIRGVLFFVVAGVIGAYLARSLLYIGMEKVGVSIAVSLANTRTLFATLIAVLLLGERLTLTIAGATLLIIAGVMVISWDKSGGQIDKIRSKKDLIFPILAGLCYGFAYVQRKFGVDSVPSPLAGVLIQNTTAFLCFILASPLRRDHQRVEMRNARAWFFYGISGILSFFANFFTFSALNIGDVIIVAPLVALNPLFTLLLAILFLKNVEQVTGKIFLGALFIIGGAVILSVMTHR